ncbi:MAG: acetyl-CoA carboxylase biotin carboxylase subunit [Armatimonadota bacterium]|nr:MAG: acetyl-CoA carboxylase biotin carboxylase subunit [Armatimonadota bacterium]
MFKKILVANRGEIAVRVIRACREMRIPTVAVYSQADADALHVRLADEAVCIGPPANRDSYLNIPNIITAALITEADAVHPGYGNLAETASFAENCDLCKLAFIGPSADTIEALQDKAQVKHTMHAAGVPVIPPEEPAIVVNDQDALKVASRSGYPMIIKAAAGGGGRGIRIVHDDDDLVRSLPVARSEAEAAFGRSEVYLERYLEEPRHIEFQILADKRGNMIHLGERECSIQTSRHQKLLEESPSMALSPSLRHRMGDAALRAAKAVGYTNAGTVEFLLDTNRKFYFLEMNARIQVEHPVTECVTGMDLVKEQIRLAAGEKLAHAQKDIQFHGHAIECRITAEDPEREFAPSAGAVNGLRLPGGPGVRVDTHLYAGYHVPPYYDPLLAKLIVWGRDRREAIARAQRALAEFEIDGFRTTISFHREVLANAFFRRGETTTDFIRRRMGL